MKIFIFALLIISSILFVQPASTECSRIPGPDGVVPKCVSAEVLDAAAEDAARRRAMAAWLDQALKFEKLTIAEILKFCTLIKEETSVSSLDAKKCDVPKESKITNRLCQFKAVFNCNVNGETGTLIKNGSCAGQMHDCGTFKYCAEDQTQFTCAKSAWREAKKDSFHTEDAVPKRTSPGLVLPAVKPEEGRN